MTRQTQQIAILVALAGVVVTVYGRAPKPARAATSHGPEVIETREASSSGATDGAGAASPQESAPVDWAAQSAKRAQQHQTAQRLAWGRDPFMRAGTGAGQLPGLALQGILWDPTDAIAIINGQMVHIGQDCDGFRVVQILQDRVVLSDGANTYELNTVP